MKKTYNKKIDRNTDWGGDASTGGLKVSGKRVQEFIKGELNSKVGAIYKEQGGTMVHCFANEEDMNRYLETEDTSLIISSFETVSRYKVLINPEGLRRTYSVIYGTTGNKISFDFKIVDDNDIVTDSKATIEYSFEANQIVTGYTTEVNMNIDGWTSITTDIIDKYLRQGRNYITVTITGKSTKASTSLQISYNLFDLSFSTAFDYTQPQSRMLAVPYNISCSDPKHIEFILDGEKVDDITILEPSQDLSANVDIRALTPGTHNLQTGAYVSTNDGNSFRTPYHYYTFINIDGATAPSFLMSMELANEQDYMSENGGALVLNVTQFDEIKFNWALWDPNSRRFEVVFEFDGEVCGGAEVIQNGKATAFSYRVMTYGENKKLVAYALGENGEYLFRHEITVNVAESATGVKETVNGLRLKLEANGRRNTEENRDSWTYSGDDGDYYATFPQDFAWSQQQGWNDETESLVISNGAVVEFNIKPMDKDWKDYGGTFEIDLETFDVDDDDAVICECKNNIVGQNSAYFRITATKAEFSTSNGVKISTRYKDNERLKIAFIGNKTGSTEDNNLIYIMVNGVLERAALYESQDSITSSATLKIGDPTGKCKVRLRSIRLYNRAISVDEEFNNFIIDSPDVQGAYERNNIFAEGTTEVGFDEIANKLPVMIFTGDMDALVKSVATKDWKPFDVEFINRQHPEFNFVSYHCQMKLQGTSSLGYPRKNFKLKTKDKNFTADLYNSPSFRYYLDDNSPVGNKRLIDRTTGQHIDVNDLKEMCITLGANPLNTDLYVPLKKGKYKFKTGAHKADKWTLKADFMESSCSHNVAAGRSWNDIFENTLFTTPAKSNYNNGTYRDSALANTDDYISYVREDGKYCHIPNNITSITSQKNYLCRTEAQKICKAAGADDIRTAVDGFPMVCFYRENHQENRLIFMGQYNFINDKSSYEVFGFEDIEDPNDENTLIYDASKVECWEGLKNANPVSLFQTIANWESEETGWASTYESRYPDPDDYGIEGKKQYNARVGSPLYELSKWLVSTRHDGDTIYDLEGNVKTTHDRSLTIDSTFAEKINGYQYGYTEDNKTGYTYATSISEQGGMAIDNAENRQKKFNTEKWEHFDVWKLAGYYIYLMRYGAVDQFVKNTMLFTDGNGKYETGGRANDPKYRKWFFINYDNDCLFGLRNNGELAFGWNLDRQTLDDAADIIHDENDEYTEDDINTYAMMGHDSTLWNNLEADDEFMRMVRDLDNAMSKFGLNYENMVEEFDTKQTEQWCERIYNANERYKYIQAAKGIGDMEGNPVDNLWMLQGTRRSHRHWWIANHFNMLNAKWLSGDYKNTLVRIKVNTPKDGMFKAKAGTNYYFAWGQQKMIYESNMYRETDQDINFIFPTNQVQGDPVDIYAVNKMSELDFSSIASTVDSGSFQFQISDENVANLLKKFVIGNPFVINNKTGIVTTSWQCLKNLEYLDITNYAGITFVPLTSFPNLHTFKAYGSGISTFIPCEGSNYDLVELPENMTTIELKNIKFSSLSNFKYTPNINLRSLTVSNTNKGGVDNSIFNTLVNKWITAIENSSQSTELYRNNKIDISNINWIFNNLNYLRMFANFKNYVSNPNNFSLKGKIDITGCGSISRANVEEIKSIFGENCFNEKLSSLYIKTPSSIFIVPEDENNVSMVAGQTYRFGYELYPDKRNINIQGITFDIGRYVADGETIADDDYIDVNEGKIVRKLYGANVAAIRSGLTITTEYDTSTHEYIGGVITCDETDAGRDIDLLVIATLDTLNEGSKVSYVEFTIKNPTYAVTADLDGEKNFYMGGDYTLELVGKTATGELPLGTHDVQWTLSGPGLDYVESTGVTDNKLSIKIVDNTEPTTYSQITAHAVYTNHDALHTVLPQEFDYTFLVLNRNVVLTTASNPVVMQICYENGWTDGDAAVMLKSQAEAVRSIGTAFSNVSSSFSFNEFKFFTGCTSLVNGAFANSNIVDITLPSTITSLGTRCFNNCTNLRNITVDGVENGNNTVPFGITSIPQSCFNNCRNLSKLRLPDSITSIGDFAFGNTNIKNVLLYNEALGENTLILPSTNYGRLMLSGKAFELEYEGEFKIANSTNRLKKMSIPMESSISSHEILLCSDDLDEIILDENCITHTMENGLLYTSDKSTLIKCVPVGPIRSYIIDENTTYISRWAFRGSKNVTFLRGTASLRNIEREAFESCGIDEIDLSPCVNLTSILSNTFKNCSRLRKLFLPDNLLLLKAHAISNCLLLSSVNFPDYLEFETNAVENCPSITRVVLPKYCPITDMSNAIESCGGITEAVLPLFSYEEENGHYTILDSLGNVVYETTTLVLAKKYLQSELANEGDHISDDFVRGTIKYVERESNAMGITFFGGHCNSLVKYILNEEDAGAVYMTLEDGCLYNSDVTQLINVPYGLTEYAMPNTVKRFGSNAFIACSVLTALTLSNTLEYLNELNGIPIKKLDVYTKVTMEGRVFVQCSELTVVTFYKGINNAKIPQFSFNLCPKLKTIILCNVVAPGLEYSPSNPPTTSECGGEYFIERTSDGGSSWTPTGDNYTSLASAFTNRSLRSSSYTIKEEANRTYSVSFNNNLLNENPIEFPASGILDYTTSFIDKNGNEVFFINNGYRLRMVRMGTYIQDFHPFGYNNSNLTGLRAEGTKVLYLPYGHTGYDHSDWVNPLLNPNLCNFQVKYFSLNSGDILVKLYKNGVQYTGVAYANSESGDYSYANAGSIASAEYNASLGGHVFICNNNIYDNETITFYTDSSFTDEIGSVVAEFGKTEYQVGEPLMGTRSTKGAILSSGKESEETITVTRGEYESLVSKVNNLIEKFSQLK